MFGEILAGVVLGPSLLHVLSWPPFREGQFDVVVAQFANLGVIFLMFIAGVETNLKQIKRVGKVAAVAGVAGVFAPMLLGLAVALPFGFQPQQAVFIGIVLTATSVSITVQTLIELKQLDTKEGVTLLAAAVIDDVIALVVLSVFVAFSSGERGGVLRVGLVALRMAAFFAAFIGVGVWVMRRALKLAERLPVSEGLLALVVAMTLVYAWAAEVVGQVASITGAYIVGVLVAKAGFREEIEHRMRAFTYAILVPIFFISIGLQTNVRLLDAADIPFALLVILAAVVGKILGCGGGAWATGFSPPEALRVGVGMVSRGEVGLIVAALGLQTGLLDARGFAVMVIMVLASTVITPVLLRAAFPRPRRPVTEAEAVERVMGDESS